jgi:hypothetical protein
MLCTGQSAARNLETARMQQGRHAEMRFGAGWVRELMAQEAAIDPIGRWPDPLAQGA